MGSLSSLLVTQRSQTPQDAMLTLRSNSLSATYPNVDIVQRNYLCNFETNVTGERTFSALKHKEQIVHYYGPKSNDGAVPTVH